MAFARRKREEPRVDLTPMVDVVFLLLIFFMISTTFVETPGISVQLPESSSQREIRVPEEFKVQVTKEGEIYAGEERISLDELRLRLAGYGTKAREMNFALYADREARHGRVVQVMDLAREAGFAKLAIATEQRRPQ
jgi:biopolymer transport protein ExbD